MGIPLHHGRHEVRTPKRWRKRPEPESHTAEAVPGHGDLEIGMTANGKGGRKRKRSPTGFYFLALDEAERAGLEEALEVEGLDDEIALLRVKLRATLVAQPDRTDLHFEAANVIARLVKTRYQISGDKSKSITEAAQKVLTEIGLPIGVGVDIKLAGNGSSSRLGPHHEAEPSSTGRCPCCGELHTEGIGADALGGDSPSRRQERTLRPP